MDNQERRNVSWWYSRHGERSRDWSGVKRSRRITLIDMLLLAVTAGIILPRLLQFSAAAQPAAQPASPPPARATVGSVLMSPDALVEIQMTARRSTD